MKMQFPDVLLKNSVTILMCERTKSSKSPFVHQTPVVWILPVSRSGAKL
jgi:hypothetical protein